MILAWLARTSPLAHSPRVLRRSLVALVIALAGCRSGEDHPEPVATGRPPDVSADATPDPDQGEPARAPGLEPPPDRGGPGFSRDQVLSVARGHDDAADAIAVLDQTRFTFRLDAGAVRWFGGQGLDPAVLDYLDKRSRIDWDALRGDVDPDAPDPDR